LFTWNASQAQNLPYHILPSVRKQMNPFAVKTTVLPSGERLPLLCSRSTGIPLFDPTVWSISELRARNLSSSTLRQALRAVMVLNLVLDRLGVDLDSRFDEGKSIDLGEVEEITRQCRLSLEDLADDEVPEPRLVSAKVVSLEKVRMRTSSARQASHVDPNTLAIRIRYIRDYLKWRTKVRLLRLGPKHALYSGLQTTADIVESTLTARIPASSGRNSLEQREGLSPEALAALLRIIDPACPDNPWKSEHLRERNALAVYWLLLLGVRRGELLGTRISHIDVRANEVLIARSADSPDDPRREQPNTKTFDRLLPLDDGLAALTRKYILGARRKITGARRNEFLIVAEKTGAPLTLGALNKVFETLRNHCPELPRNFNAHVLRHTWNDHFSELMTKQKVPEAEEKKMRSHLMGWSENSTSAATYIRRYVREQAGKASLALQSDLNTEKSNAR
jgi:integrase